MGKKIYFSIAAAVLISIAACTKVEENAAKNDVPVLKSSGIQPAVMTVENGRWNLEASLNWLYGSSFEACRITSVETSDLIVPLQTSYSSQKGSAPVFSVDSLRNAVYIDESAKTRGESRILAMAVALKSQTPTQVTFSVSTVYAIDIPDTAVQYVPQYFDPVTDYWFASNNNGRCSGPLMGEDIGRDATTELLSALWNLTLIYLPPNTQVVDTEIQKVIGRYDDIYKHDCMPPQKLDILLLDFTTGMWTAGPADKILLGPEHVNHKINTSLVGPFEAYFYYGRFVIRPWITEEMEDQGNVTPYL